MEEVLRRLVGKENGVGEVVGQERREPTSRNLGLATLMWYLHWESGSADWSRSMTDDVLPIVERHEWLRGFFETRRKTLSDILSTSASSMARQKKPWLGRVSHGWYLLTEEGRRAVETETCTYDWLLDLIREEAAGGGQKGGAPGATSGEKRQRKMTHEGEHGAEDVSAPACGVRFLSAESSCNPVISSSSASTCTAGAGQAALGFASSLSASLESSSSSSFVGGDHSGVRRRRGSYKNAGLSVNRDSPGSPPLDVPGATSTVDFDPSGMPLLAARSSPSDVPVGRGQPAVENNENMRGFGSDLRRRLAVRSQGSVDVGSLPMEEVLRRLAGKEKGGGEVVGQERRKPSSKPLGVATLLWYLHWESGSADWRGSLTQDVLPIVERHEWLRGFFQRQGSNLAQSLASSASYTTKAQQGIPWFVRRTGKYQLTEEGRRAVENEICTYDWLLGLITEESARRGGKRGAPAATSREKRQRKMTHDGEEDEDDSLSSGVPMGKGQLVAETNEDLEMAGSHLQLGSAPMRSGDRGNVWLASSPMSAMLRSSASIGRESAADSLWSDFVAPPEGMPTPPPLPPVPSLSSNCAGGPPSL
jgi:hypothetical protein